MTTPPPPGLVPDRPSDAEFFAFTVRDLAEKVAYSNGGTISITKAQACAIGQYVHDTSRKLAAIDAAAPPTEAPAEHVLRFGPFTVSASNEGGSWSIVVSKGRKVCALVDEAAPAAPAEGVMGWATPDGRVCSTRDKALALVQDASAYTIPLAPRVTGGREDDVGMEHAP